MKISLFKGIFFGIFGLAALIGLFVFATYSGKSTSATAVGHVAIWGTLPAASMQSMLATAAQTDPAFKDVTYTQKNPLTLATDLSAAIATSKAPDAVLASQEELNPLRPFLIPIPYSALPASTFSNAFIQEAALLSVPGGGGYYGVPFLVDPLALFSNRSILSSSGIAKPPATWEALTGLVPVIAQLSPTRQVTRGLIALGTYANVHDARAILSTLFLQQGIPMSGYTASGIPAADLGVSTDSGRPSGTAIVGFYTQFADASKVSYTWNSSLPDSQQKFAAGDLALYLGYISETRFLSSANPNLDFVVSAVPEPATARTKSVAGKLYSFMIPRGATNSSGAFQVATLLASSVRQQAAATATGLAPVSLSALSTIPSDPTGAVAYAEALYAKGWLSPAPADTDVVFSSMIGDVISGRLSPSAALSSAQNALSSLLQQ